MQLYDRMSSVTYSETSDFLDTFIDKNVLKLISYLLLPIEHNVKTPISCRPKLATNREQSNAGISKRNAANNTNVVI